MRKITGFSLVIFIFLTVNYSASASEISSIISSDKLSDESKYLKIVDSFSTRKIDTFLSTVRLSPSVEVKSFVRKSFSFQDVPSLFKESSVLHLELTNNVFSDILSSLPSQFSGIRLLSCSDCLVTMDNETMSLWLNPLFVSKIIEEYPRDYEEILYFVIAHEISHVVHELSIALNGASPNALPSYIQKWKILSKMSEEDKHQRFLASVTHAEIDFIAYSILESMGRKRTIAVSSFLLEFLSEGDVGEDPFVVSLKSLHKKARMLVSIQGLN